MKRWISWNVGFRATWGLCNNGSHVTFFRYRDIAAVMEGHWTDVKDVYWALAKPKDAFVVFTGNNKVFDKKVTSDMRKFKPALKVNGSGNS